jgi:3-oxoadipate enol-lactonase
MKKVILKNAKIAYRRDGVEGKPRLLMLHGIFTSSCYFEEIIEFLESDFDILAPDFPGFGHSDKLKDIPHNLDTYTDTVKELCDCLSFKPFCLVGASLGGMLGIIFTSKYPLYVEKLVLQASPWCDGCINMQWAAKAFDAVSNIGSAVKIASKVKGIIPRDILLSVFKVFNKHYFRIDKKNGRVYYSFKYMNLEATQEIWHSVREADLTDYVRRVEKPTLLISGDHDEQVFPEKIREMADIIPRARFELLKGKDCTHALFFDHPERMAGLIRGFCFRK